MSDGGGFVSRRDTDRMDASDARSDESDYRQDRSDQRSDLSDTRQDASDVRSDESDDRMNRSDARQDVTEAQMVENVARMGRSDNRIGRGEDLAKRRHHADLSQRVVVVITIAVVMAVLGGLAYLAVSTRNVQGHLLLLEQENKELNEHLIKQQELLGEVASTITKATLYAVACAEPDGPETIEQIQACVDKRIRAAGG